jgi:hypothetical protein
MIIDLLFFLLGAILNGIAALFSLLTFVIPQDALAAIANAFSYLAYLQAFFPIDTFLTVASSFFGFLLVWYSWRLIMFVYSLVPGIGKEG